MTEKDKGFKFEQFDDDSWDWEEDANMDLNESEADEETKAYQEIIEIIGSVMLSEDFSLQNKSSFIIKKALDFLDKEIEENKNFIEAWLIKGTIFYKTERYSNAIQAFDTALENIPEPFGVAFEEELEAWEKSNGTNFKYALELKALAFFKLGKYTESLDPLDKILAVYPEDTEIQKYRDMVSALENENLIRELNNIPYICLEGSDIRENESEYTLNPERYEELLDNFASALEINPDDADIWGYKGSILYRLEKYEEAIEACNEAIDISPKNASVWAIRGSALYMLDKPKEALKAFDNSLQKNPNLFEVWINKAFILFKMERYRQAATAVENALRIKPDAGIALKLKTAILKKVDK
ncbi:MAG: tetratricopeptide repeat protein [Methanococcaceae archaeon]